MLENMPHGCGTDTTLFQKGTITGLAKQGKQLRGWKGSGETSCMSKKSRKISHVPDWKSVKHLMKSNCKKINLSYVSVRACPPAHYEENSRNWD